MRLLAQDPADDDAEDRERRELIEVIGSLERRHRQPLVFLDLHTTSGPSSPCGTAGRSRRRRSRWWRRRRRR